MRRRRRSAAARRRWPPTARAAPSASSPRSRREALGFPGRPAAQAIDALRESRRVTPAARTAAGTPLTPPPGAGRRRRAEHGADAGGEVDGVGPGRGGVTAAGVEALRRRPPPGSSAPYSGDVVRAERQPAQLRSAAVTSGAGRLSAALRRRPPRRGGGPPVLGRGVPALVRERALRSFGPQPAHQVAGVDQHRAGRRHMPSTAQVWTPSYSYSFCSSAASAVVAAELGGRAFPGAARSAAAG